MVFGSRIRHIDHRPIRWGGFRQKACFVGFASRPNALLMRLCHRLIMTEQPHVGKRVVVVALPVPLTNDFEIHEQPVGSAVNIAEQPIVLIARLVARNEPNLLSDKQSFQERAGFGTKRLDRLRRMDGFGCVDAD